MSIYFDFDIGPTGRQFRRAVDDDKHDIQSISNPKDVEMFGEVDIGSLIELRTLSICMMNENKDVVGFMALCDHPNVAGVDPVDWEIWIRNMYQKFYLSRNTLFVHFMCCSDSVADYFLSEAIISVFMNDFYLLQIVLIVPYVCPEDYFDRFNIFKKHNVHKVYATQRDDGVFTNRYIYVFDREEFCPSLKMRRAVEEDNDDVVEILDKYSLSLRELYGSFYISEIIGRHPESNRTILVADIHERTVGVICLNSDINYEKLQELYELKPFFGLRKATAVEKEEHRRSNVLLQRFGEPIMQGKCSPFSYPKEPTIKENHSGGKKNVSNNKTKKLSKVNFRREGSVRKSIVNRLDDQHHSDESSYRSSRSTSFVTHTKSLVDLLDEEPLDYEIVNIDNTLFSVPGDSFFDMPFPTSRPLFRPEVQYTKSKKKKTVTRNTDRKRHDTVHYHGGPNAFMIELFGLREDIDERCAFDLLRAAFEVMDMFDYCIIRVPCSDKGLHSLLQHFCFVPTKDEVCCEYALFVAHRCSVLGNLRVREVELLDIPQIACMLHELGSNETIWSIESSIAKSKPYSAYVFLSGLTPVGIAILEKPEAINFIRTKFNLDAIHCHKYHFPGHGIGAGIASLKTVLAYPAFEPHYRFFAREIMRLSGSNALLWLTAYRNKWIVNKANSLVAAMVPLRARKCEMDCVNTRDFKKMQDIAANILDFSAWYIGKKITSIQKVIITTRIVVVGASRTATNFLSTLFFSDASSYLTFTNVTLVSPYGLPFVRSSKSPAAMMFLKYHSKSEKYLKSIPYTYYMNVVYGTMTDIDKQEKCITLNDGSKFYYDYLFLLFGKQYQHPDYLKPAMKRDDEFKRGSPPKYVRLDVPRRSDSYIEAMHTPDETPRNVFIVNHIVVAHKAMDYVRRFIWSGNNYKILVYGATIHAYCCLAALLELGVPPANIVFIEPFPPDDPTKTRIPTFNNVNVDQTVKQVLKNLKITGYRSYYFQEWLVDVSNIATHVNFVSHFHVLSLECSVLFYYGKRAINAASLIAINKCGLAYNGGILIDNKFNTNDPSIYAAGPATRYYSRYFAKTSRQKYYDSCEVGERLGTQIIRQLDPLFSGRTYKPGRETTRASNKKVSFAATSSPSDSFSSSGRSSSHESNSKPDDTLPALVKPVYMYCTMPGGLQYLEVRPPGSKVPHHYIQSLNYNGIVLETFKGGYFKIHLNKELIVDGITCLTYEKYSLHSLKNLYGMSAIVLNNVHLRFATGKVESFYEFFRAPWSFFLYYDRCEDLFAMAKELMPKGHRWGPTIRQALRTVGKNLSSVSLVNDAKVDIRTNFDASPYSEAIAEYLMEWVAENDVLLPMYLQPLYAAECKSGLDHNPVFKKKQKLSKIMTKVFADSTMYRK